MKLMSSSSSPLLLRCPCTEFNLHSPKSHAVIWHVYQTEATQQLLCLTTPARPFATCASHLPAHTFICTVHLYSSSERAHSLSLSPVPISLFSPCTNDAYLAAAQAINLSPYLPLSVYLFLSLCLCSS